MILITGGTGFIGNYVIQNLLQKNNTLVVVVRNKEKAKVFKWFNKVELVEMDIHQKIGKKDSKIIEKCNSLIHLAWSGLPNFDKMYHVKKNLNLQFIFLRKIIELGITDITVTGTCLEYGLIEGELDPKMRTNPVVPYAIAKDKLRKKLFQLNLENKFNLKWLRLFYMFGDGQSEKSILSQLQFALDNKKEIFNMSAGEQERDYLHVQDVARIIVDYAKNKENGIYNVCSGKSIKIKNLVKNYLTQNNKNIQLNYGYYDYNNYEPMSFWGKKNDNL